MNSIFKYIMFAVICIPIVVVLWAIAIAILVLISFPLVIRGCLEAVHNEVWG